MNKYLIVGLGNPGREYANTRHNAGFLIADKLVKDEGGTFQPGRHGDIASIKYKGRPVTVVKPSTFMNLSGKAVSYWLSAEGIQLENMMVLVDELALPFGKIRIGPKGSDGGHNGLKSVQEAIGTPGYPRLRFGIGNGFAKGGQVDFVLSEWGDEEKKTLDTVVAEAADAVRMFVFAGLQHSMNKYNR
jgi:peptidyl-tRNA hydrolase, PTH1 family